MKQTLSIRYFVLLFLLAFCNKMHAQITINTVYTNAPSYLVIHQTPNSATPAYVTFTVKNENCYPVTLQGVNLFHAVNQGYGTFPNNFDLNNNGAVYTLLRQGSGAVTSDPTTVAPTLNNWIQVGTSGGPVTAAASGIAPVITGVTDVIASNTEIRYAIVSTDTLPIRTTPGLTSTTVVIPSPGTFTANGVTLQTVDPNGVKQKIHHGVFPNVSNAHSPFFANTGQIWIQYGMEGGIVVKRGGPTVSVVNNNACDLSGDFVTLTASVPSCVTPSSYTWQGPGITGSPTGNSVQIPAVLANSGKYYVSYTVTPPLPGVQETSAATEVTVNITPRAPKPTITTKTAYCIGEPFQPVVANGQNILWYTTPTGGTGTTVPPYVNTNTAGSYTWYASQTINNCEGDRQGVTITVAPIPARPAVVSPKVYCENEVATPLTAGGTGLIWYVDPVGGLGSVIAPVPGTSVKDTLTWYVSQKIDGCEGPRSKLDVIVTFKPNGMVLVSDTPWICQFEELTFTYYGSATEFTGITWAVPDGAVSVNKPVGIEPIRIRFDSAGLKKVIMSANNLGCLADPYVQYVTVKPLPTGKIAAPADVCPNDDEIISLYEYMDGIDTFNWKWDGGVTTHFATDQGPYGVYWATPGVKVVSLEMVKDLCYGLATDTVVVRELPDAKIKAFFHNERDNRFDDFDYKKATICSGDSLRLEPNTIVASSQYEWTPTRFFDNSANIPVAYGRIDFTGNVKLKVTDDLGCVSTDSIRVETKPCCELTFPNAFTPNGDGRNDAFRAITQGYHNTRTFQIANRYGQIVYESVDEHRGWDGTMKGEPADMGTYFYHINFKCDGKWVDQSGEFMLVR